VERIPIPTLKTNFRRWVFFVDEAKKAFKEGGAIRLGSDDYAPFSPREAALLIRNSAFLTSRNSNLHVKTEQDCVLVWFSDQPVDEDEDERWRDWAIRS
jgi:hypothetical protein